MAIDSYFSCNNLDIQYAIPISILFSILSDLFYNTISK